MVPNDELSSMFSSISVFNPNEALDLYAIMFGTMNGVNYDARPYLIVWDPILRTTQSDPRNRYKGRKGTFIVGVYDVDQIFVCV